MSPMKNGPSDKKDSFTFLSFLQCNRHSKSGSNDSGISTSEQRNNIGNNGVIVISDEDDSNEPEFEMLCGVEFDETDALPMPIEQKFICKTEPENMQESSYVEEQQSSSVNESLITPKEEADTTANLSECEDELMPLCKVENGDAALKNNYILFICPQCGMNFTNSSHWKLHIDKAHNLNDQSTFNFTQRPNNNFQCNKCQAIITRCTLKTLQQHRFQHLPFKVYKCKLCRHDERSLYLMISHIMLHKEKEELEVMEKPGTKAMTVKKSVVELETKQLIAYICPVCGVSFEGEDTWQAHINFKHNFLEKTAENRFDDHFKCSECSVEIFSQHVGDLQQHLFTHLPFKSFLKCKVCNWTISRRNFMISHILNLHTSSKTATTTAAATATATATISSDKLSTSLPSVFIYDDDDDDDDVVTESEQTANKASTSMIAVPTQPDDLTEWRPNYRSKGFKCARCSSCFKTAAERNAHNVAHHGKYVCSKCNENFAIKADMKRHNCNKLVNVFECPKCLKEYNYEKCFQNHVRRCTFQMTQRVRGEISAFSN